MRNGEIPSQWTDLVQRSVEIATDDDFNLATTWANNFLTGNATAIDEEDSTVVGILLNNNGSASAQDSQSDTNASSISKEATNVDVPAQPVHVNISEEATDASISEEGTSIDPLLFPTMPDLNDFTCRRSKRTRCTTKRAKESFDPSIRRIFSLFVACTAIFGGLSSANTMPSVSSALQNIVLHTEQINTHFDGTINAMHHAVLTTIAGDNDTYTLKDMLRQEDKGEFIKAMVKEVQDHESRNHWTVIPRSDMPSGNKSILSVWSFKCKQAPDGRILKYKAQLCAHGGMQTWGVNYWEMYAPVVNWLSVRALMAISVIHDLETRSIDFVLAFPQADLDVDIYMELPYGFDFDGQRHFLLKLNKNLYGLKSAS
jgi:hypothetical protein